MTPREALEERARRWLLGTRDQRESDVDDLAELLGSVAAEERARIVRYIRKHADDHAGPIDDDDTLMAAATRVALWLGLARVLELGEHMKKP